MNREVEIYIEGTEPNTTLGYGYNYDKLDLFKDEFINISSSIQNIQDLSKVYTDFSQSFTVPSTPNNDKIFEYFYQNDVDNAIDHNLRRYAYIEVGKTPFRSGKIQLEGSILKNSKAEHYTITFYGDLVSLKDTFSNKKLSDLNYSAISNPYTGAGVKARLTDTATDYDVRYPMISSDGYWTYADASSTDLSTSTGRLTWNELFPAIKVSKIFEAIQTDFGLTFNSNFLNSDVFKKLFLWCKNTDNQDNKMNGASMLVDSYTDYANSVTGLNEDIYQTDTNTFKFLSTPQNKARFDVTVIINKPTAIGSFIVYVDTYHNGVRVSTAKIDSSISNSEIVCSTPFSNMDFQLYFKVRSEAPVNLQYTIQVNRYNEDYSVNLGYVQAFKNTDLVLSTSSNSIYLNVPNITIADFFSGILKQFNLTCYATAFNTFQIEPVDDWYSKGAIIDITKYVDVNDINIDRLPLYKNISFNYEKSESFINRAFGDASNREWGDTSLNYDYDGGDYTVKLPFENLQFQKYSTTPMQVAFSLTKYPDYKSYIPKPVLLYYNGAMTTAIRFYDGTTETTENNLALFGNDLSYNNQIYSLNFAPETSTWYDKPIENSLFANYYFGYLSNLFNSKNRLTKLTAYFPISLITSLKLNDRLIIKDKRYLINTINSEITNGKVQLELINDFRPIRNSTGLFTADDSGGTITVGVGLSTTAQSSNISTVTTGVTFSTSTITTDTNVLVTIPSNPDPKYILTSQSGEILISQDSFNLRSQQGDDATIVIDVDETMRDGSTDSYTINILQE
jgi:hypothetical protein